YELNVGQRWDGSKAASGRRQGPLSTGKLTRPLGRRRDRVAHQLRQTVLAHQHFKRGGGRAAGRRHVLPQHRGIELRAVQQLAGAGNGFPRELGGKGRRQAGGDAGLGQRFGQEEDIGGGRSPPPRRGGPPP